MSTVYDLVQAAAQLILDLEEAEGELTPESEALLDAFVSGSEDKLAGIRALLTRFKSEAEYLKAEETRLHQRRRGLETAERQVRSLGVELLTATAALTGEPKVKTADYTAWLGTTYSCTGPRKADEWPLFARRIVVEHDRQAMIAALKAGQAYPGFTLIKRSSLHIR